MQSTPIKVPDSGRAQHLHVAAGGCSVPGARRDKNEDRQYVSPDTHLFIVADGMNENDNPQAAAERLTQQAIANDAGDDVTCVVFFVQSDVLRAPAVPPSPTIWNRLASLFKRR